MYTPKVAYLGCLAALLIQVRASDKRGIGWSIDERELAPLKQIFEGGSKIKWWFNWNKCWDCRAEDAFYRADRQAVGDPAGANGAEFMPLVWTPHTLDEATKFQKGYNAVMSFNEPDTANPPVAAFVDPAVAAEEWKRMVNKIKGERPKDFAAGKIRLVSPAPANDIGWLKNFYTALCGPQSAASAWRECAYAHPPDTVSVHAYAKALAGVQSKVDEYHYTFQRPVMLSEYACEDFSGAPPASQDEVVQYMKDTVAWLEATEYVWKYAYFGNARSEALLHQVAAVNRLMTPDGKITELGKLYRSL